MTNGVPVENLADEVRDIARHCLFNEEELIDGIPPTNAVLGDGIISTLAFHPVRLEESKSRIRAILDEMPDDFHASKGGGMSFLNLCMDRNGNHWAEHPTLGILCSLGLAAGMVSYPMPRDMWSILPGGMPYVTINTKI